MKHRLRDRIIGLTLAILLLAIILNSLISTLLFRKSYFSALQSEMQVICLHLKSQVERITQLGIPVQDIEGLDQQCREVTAQHPDVVYAMIVQADGKVLFQSEPKEVRRRIVTEELLRGLARREKTLCTSRYQGLTCYNMILPIDRGEALAVIGVPTTLITRKAYTLMAYGLEVGLVSVVVAMVLLWVGLSTTVTRPLSRLLDTIQEISHSSDLSKRVEVTSADELGVLAESFNRMTGALQKTTTSVDALQREVEHRTQAERHQADLLVRLEAVNKELSSFAYVVSHDLKAPLRGIQTIADWMQVDYADRLDEDGKEQLRLLCQRVSRMKNLIDGILTYSRVNRIEEALTPIDLNTLLPEIIDSLAVPRSIHIAIDKTLPSIVYERTRITQIFQNLLSNAVKYMDKEEGLIRIDALEDPETWAFSVSDNGPGIEERYFEKIFGLFQTLASRDQYESTGVGLAVVKKHVEMAGGRIWVTSEVGKGSTFHFTVPRPIPVSSSESPLTPGKMERAALGGS